MSDLSTDVLTSSTFSRFLDEEGLETLANRIDQVFARKGEGGSKLEYAIYEDSPTLYPHDVNDLIKYNGIYYKVKVAMAEAGVALVVGTNIELANLPAGTGVFLDKIPGSGGGGGGGDASVVKVRYEVSPTENEHALNELIYYNGKVYKCTVAMPDPGVTLVVGTNIELPSLSSTTIVMADGLPGTGMDASDVSFDNTDTDLESDDVQGAITELNSKTVVLTGTTVAQLCAAVTALSSSEFLNSKLLIEGSIVLNPGTFNSTQNFKIYTSMSLNYADAAEYRYYLPSDSSSAWLKYIKYVYGTSNTTETVTSTTSWMLSYTKD